MSKNILGVLNENDVETITTLIDPEINKVVARYLYDENNKILISTEYKFFPDRIHVFWHEENITLAIDLTNVQKNTNINSLYWKMPNITPKTNIGE